METQNLKELLSVKFNEDNNTYSVFAASGSSLNEVMFCLSVVIKCLVKDGIIEDSSKAMAMLTRYLVDPQFEEVINEEHI